VSTLGFACCGNMRGGHSVGSWVVLSFLFYSVGTIGIQGSLGVTWDFPLLPFVVGCFRFDLPPKLQVLLP